MRSVWVYVAGAPSTAECAFFCPGSDGTQQAELWMVGPDLTPSLVWTAPTTFPDVSGSYANYFAAPITGGAYCQRTKMFYFFITPDGSGNGVIYKIDPANVEAGATHVVTFDFPDYGGDGDQEWGTQGCEVGQYLYISYSGYGYYPIVMRLDLDTEIIALSLQDRGDSYLGSTYDSSGGIGYLVEGGIGTLYWCDGNRIWTSQTGDLGSWTWTWTLFTEEDGGPTALVPLYSNGTANAMGFTSDPVDGCIYFGTNNAAYELLGLSHYTVEVWRIKDGVCEYIYYWEWPTLNEFGDAWQVAGVCRRLYDANGVAGNPYMLCWGSQDNQLNPEVARRPGALAEWEHFQITDADWPPQSYLLSNQNVVSLGGAFVGLVWRRFYYPDSAASYLMYGIDDDWQILQTWVDRERVVSWTGSAFLTGAGTTRLCQSV